MGFVAQKVLLNLILPPASLLLLILSGLILLRWRRTAGRALMAIGIILLYALSLDPVADKLIRPLEEAYRPYAGIDARPEAVVVLGGGVHDLRWVPAPPAPSGQSLERLVQGIYRARALHRPLFIAGGSGSLAPDDVPEADAMADMAVKLGFPRGDIIIDNRSRNTWENAEAVKQALQGKTIILVTSAYHMIRSSGVFKKQGFTVVPDPTGYLSQTQHRSPAFLLPQARALSLSSTAIAEYLSLAWYWTTGKL
jgi:uncharacterized SAM-binding protein YcdF (DUF218 family)